MLETEPSANLLCGMRSYETPQDKKELEDHIRALRRYARALIGNRSDADDLVQETLRRALTYLSDGREIRNPRAYLLTMLHHVRVDHVKRLIRNNDQIPLDEMVMPSVPASQLLRLECRDMAAAIEALPIEQREVLLLVCLEGLSYQETADMVGSPIGTVMSRLSRARNALRRALSEDIPPFADDTVNSRPPTRPTA
jgi:RNA polymerase sigma-70 factor (ECF subfamily)